MTWRVSYRRQGEQYVVSRYYVTEEAARRHADELAGSARVIELRVEPLW